MSSSTVDAALAGRSELTIDRAAPPPMRFLETEAAISGRLARPVRHPIRVFDVDGVGVSLADLQRQIGPSFSRLPWDEYDTKRSRIELLKNSFPQQERFLDEFLPDYFADARGLDDLQSIVDALGDEDRRIFHGIKPFRRRAMASFVLRKSDHRVSGWEVERQPDLPFRQSKDHQSDYRGLQRRFAPSPPEVADTPVYKTLIRRLAKLTDELRGGSIRTMRIACHQMGLVARPATVVTNAPEGIHQDGADYIVSALVVERRGVEGAESVVYGPDKRTEYLRRRLNEGEGIFQADVGSPLWHWVTPIRPVDPDSSEECVRNILGYDIHID